MTPRKVRACPKGSTSPHFSVFVAKSLKWPGAIAAATKPNTITNVYVGFAVPSATTSFTPRQPRNITMVSVEGTSASAHPCPVLRGRALALGGRI